ncbi:hypothetical protein AVEN_231418-1 [Araneus ventricosus]|uniref:Secreted protein n=1 Tax=Araneus ventricosus TaxID=182803 RepID=A0A4Y2VEA9_ARAVE|nr:hypothetical protein AVEN_231418-1 [Araneus ventricosus]
MLWEHWIIVLIHLCVRLASTTPKGAHLLEPLKKTLISFTLPQAYIPESDIKFYFTSVLQWRFPVRHLLEPESKVTRTPQTSRTQPVRGC